jgi:hypothetical protein
MIRLTLAPVWTARAVRVVGAQGRPADSADTVVRWLGVGHPLGRPVAPRSAVPLAAGVRDMGHVLLAPCTLAAGVRDMGHVLLTPCMLAAGVRDMGHVLLTPDYFRMARTCRGPSPFMLLLVAASLSSFRGTPLTSLGRIDAKVIVCKKPRAVSQPA